MRRRLKIGLSLLLGVLVIWLLFGLWSISASYPIIASAPGFGPDPIRGAWHVHSNESHDGFGTKDEIVAAAKRAGLRFVVMTEHNRAFEKEVEDIDGVLLLHGIEWSTPFGHLVQLGGNRTLEPRPSKVSEVRSRGGQAYLAHPFQDKNPWVDWSQNERADGLEIYSLDTMSRALLNHPGRALCAAGALAFNRPHSLLTLMHPQEDHMEKLVALAREREQVALCALDAHGIPSYDWVFPFLSMHLNVSDLPSNAEEAAQVVKEAIARRDAVCVLDFLGVPRGFHVSRESSEGTLIPGEKLVLHLPSNAAHLTRVVVWGDGKLESDGVTVVAQQAGALLIQVELLTPDCPWGTRWLPWILLSPFRIEDRNPRD